MRPTRVARWGSDGAADGAPSVVLHTHRMKSDLGDAGGTLSDSEVMTLCKISRNTYYKYKRELKA